MMNNGIPIMDDEMQRTNADRIRAMSDEELAKLMADDWCELVCGSGKDYCYGNCEKQILEWMKKEATDGGNV